MLIYSMSVSVDGFIAHRDGAFGWSVPSDELFRFHLDQVRGLGSCLLGRRLYETMLVWETDPSLRDNEDTDAFADVWCAIPKVVFSRTLDSVQATPGSPRRRSPKRSPRHSTRPTRTSKSAAPAWPGRRSSLGLVDELRMFRYPVVVGGGTPFLPPVPEHVPLEVIETRTFGSRLIYERYRRARDD